MKLVSRGDGEITVALSEEEARTIMIVLSNIVGGDYALSDEDWKANGTLEDRDLSERISNELYDIVK